ncbi:DUF4145 domain-containing protein [Proteus terrae]|uniref:DUF4145 domain-containing protein n=1 Tax=Proteus terrae TaxID=1574161 RepID=UPI0038A32D63
MTLNRKNWTKFFQPQSLPIWMCPKCMEYPLILADAHSFKSYLTVESQADQYYQHHCPMDDSYTYHATLICSDKNCKKLVITTGEGFVDLYVDDSSGNVETKYEVYYQPKYFNPSLDIFPLPEQTPPVLAKAIRKSFELFFTDSNASLNQLRSAVETLLNELGVERNDKNGHPLKLHSRLDKLKDDNAKYRESLKAIKWLGNAGSHSTCSTKVKLEDVLDGYEILQPILYELFRNKERTTEELVSAINANKGPIKRSA